MNSQISYTSTALCVACLSSGRRLNLINNIESKRMFSGLLDKLEHSDHPIPLCYECAGRLKSIERFKKQVNLAHTFLIGYTKSNKLPISLSKLGITKKTDTYQWEPQYSNFNLEDSLQGNYLEETKPEKKEISDDSRDKNESDPPQIINSDIDISDDDFNSHDNITNTFKQDCTKNIEPLKGQKSDIITLCSGQNVTWEVKIENLSETPENPLNQIKEEPIEENNKQETNEPLMKSETEYEFNDSDDEPLKPKLKPTKKSKKEKSEQKRERPAGVVSGVWVKKKLQQLNVPHGQLEMVVLSWDEVESERQKSLAQPTFTRHEFRCAECVVGFNHRFKLDAHMKKHAPEAGELECNVCKSRFKTQGALLCHRRRHRNRWRCSQCLALFSRAGIAADHHARAHGAPPPTHTCHVCGHCEPSLGKLRMHLKNHAERQHCEQCGKSFRDKSSLRTHLYIHTNQKDFACSVCEKRFRFKKALEIHSLTHQAPELLYCTDCDVNFKNRLSFYQHMKYSMKHIHPDKIKYACEFCPRRFSKPARLQEHRLSLHLKLAPHRCTVEGCTFASASRPAVRTHVRMVHRNKRLERNHVCHTCGKAYTTKKILEGHIRSHTGERPFSCGACAATFSHEAALYNHNKLVHKIPFVRRRKPTQPPTWPASEPREAPTIIGRSPTT